MKSKPKITEITVTPDNVDDHIDKCNSNRNLDRKHINTWKRAIHKKIFRDGGLIFSDEKGKYDDGNHRLRALKETGHTAIFYVVSGMDRETLNMMVDAGKKRTNQDRLKMIKGVNYPTTVAPAIEEIIDITEDWRRTARMLLPDEVLQFYHQHRRELETLSGAYQKFPDISAKLLVALQFLFTRIDQVKSDEFFVGVTHRHSLKAGEPLRAFYDMLASEKFLNTEGTKRRYDYTRNGLLIAWAAHLKGQTLDKIELTQRYITLEGTVSASEPEPEVESEEQAEFEEAQEQEADEQAGEAAE